jgi:hypothetical protein
MLPEGVVYHNSWIDAQSARCFQVMEADDMELLRTWIGRWSDLVDFDVVPVVVSSEYWARFSPRPLTEPRPISEPRR